MDFENCEERRYILDLDLLNIWEPVHIGSHVPSPTHVCKSQHGGHEAKGFAKAINSQLLNLKETSTYG